MWTAVFTIAIAAAIGFALAAVLSDRLARMNRYLSTTVRMRQRILTGRSQTATSRR
jgi:hypothetical protein